jgi:hypothetical protein
VDKKHAFLIWVCGVMGGIADRAIAGEAATDPAALTDATARDNAMIDAYLAHQLNSLLEFGFCNRPFGVDSCSICKPFSAA